MGARNAISRRHMLKISAAGAAAFVTSARVAVAQSATRIDRFAAELDDIISVSEPIRELATGFRTAEGPLWWKEGGYLLFSDIDNNRRMKYAPGQGTSVVKESANRANGLTRDLEGRLVAAETETRQVVRYDSDGKATVLADRYQSRRLNRPNDVVVTSKGAIYFTDPLRPELSAQREQPVNGIYRVEPDLSAVTLVAENFVFPNGLAFSPDERVLYVGASTQGEIHAFDVMPNGLLARETQRVVADLRGSEPGGPDGLKVDSAGNIYCGGSGGIHVVSPTGKKLGRIVHGHPNTTNVAFGGDDWKTLFFTTRSTLGAVNLKIPGIPVPVLRKP